VATKIHGSKKGKLQIVAFVALACCAGACDSSTSSAPIIKKYEAAACVPFSATPTIIPHTREWDTALTFRDGAQVIVKGFGAVSGNITVSYPATGRVVVAADPNDYIYPSDVRLDAQNELLYGFVHFSSTRRAENTSLILRTHAENIWTDAENTGYNLRRSAENVYP
jgi:hypothetical protein